MFFSDNLAIVHIINKMSSTDSVVMSLVRRLVLACLGYNILFRAEHISGKQNNLPDLFSRLQVEKFSRISQTHGQVQYYTIIHPKYLPIWQKLHLRWWMLLCLKALKYLTRPPCQCIKNICKKIFHSFPVYPSSVMHISYFVVTWPKKSHNTIGTYLAGMSYYHQIRELPDPSQFFLIKKLIKGAQRLSGTPDVRLHITPNILHKLVKSLHFTVSGNILRGFCVPCLLLASLPFYA